MSDVKHTPLEWQTDRPSTMGMNIYGDCNTDNMHSIAIVRWQPDDMHVKDARYIVTACNAYPALVEALEQCVYTLSNEISCGNVAAVEAKRMARAALAQAKGE